MSPQEKIDATKDLMEDLEEHRNNKSLKSHNVPISAFYDIRATLDSLANLSARTGCHTALITVRGDLDHYNRPYVYLSDDHVGDFFQLALKETPSNFATRLEGYCVISNYKKSFLQLKSRTSALTLNKLCEAMQVPIPRMYYVNFDENIIAQHSVVLENWPLTKFASPGDIGLMVEVKIVYNAFMSGATKFRKLTAAEWQEWEEARFNQDLEHTEEGEDPLPASTSQPVYAKPESAPMQRKQAHNEVDGGIMHIISGISGMGGDKVSVAKKARKTRSDKGTKEDRNSALIRQEGLLQIEHR
ncbi:uncharacterized protein F5147DRAFT_769755 [Suillus discolor]|uniref:Uncharacterized protein n=1 Tax=Suillus discolor TaxID=1912936 RepID=A0A9P7FFX7_9AGAM|nr:uncharacterized protein F5147DRAFT_769755 [Suillus discolor]KAG2115298.1 hypothetical protein F5147DRAFT_769755 [Suillus discolor]